MTLLHRALLPVAVVSVLAGVPARQALRTDAATPHAPRVTKPVSFSLLEDYDKGESLERVARDFARMRELGVTTWRGSIGWDDIEPRRGHLDLSWLERFVALAEREHVTLRPYLAYTPAWAAAGGADEHAWNDAPSSLEAWGRFVGAIARVAARHPIVASLEIYNEQNVPLWWDASPAAYDRVFARAVEAVAAAGVRVPVVPGGLVYADAPWIARLCGESGRRIDRVTLHAYPETWTSPDVTLERYLGANVDEFVETADAACGRVPLWINEAGFASAAGHSEADQANWWARAIPTFLAHPRVEHVGISEMTDLAADRPAIGDALNHHLGLRRTDGTPKPAFATVATLVGLLDGGTLTVADGDVTLQDAAAGAADVVTHLFERADGRRVLFVWTTRGETTVSVLLARRAARVTEHKLDGSVAPFARVDGAELISVEATRQVRIFEVE